MPYNRQELKYTARQRIRQNAVPSILMVTLVYLLLTNLLDSLLSIFYASDSNDLLVSMEDALLEGDVDLFNTLSATYYASDSGLVSMFFTILMTLFCAAITVGFCSYMLKIVRNQQDAGYGDLSYGLEILPKVILLTVLKTLFIFLWSMLFIIPGIIATYRYKMAEYILVDNPEISPLEAIRRSKEMMHGHKLRLLVLEISFYGWAVLVYLLSLLGSEGGYLLGEQILQSLMAAEVLSVVLSFVGYLIIGLWLTAYMQLAEAYFYQQLCSNGVGMIPPTDPYGNNGGSSYFDSSDSPWD